MRIRLSANLKMLSAVPPTTHDINAVDHDGQVSEGTLNRLVDRGANSSMFDGLRTDELKTVMEETQVETIPFVGLLPAQPSVERLIMALRALICASSLEKPRRHRACLVTEITAIPSRMIRE